MDSPRTALVSALWTLPLCDSAYRKEKLPVLPCWLYGTTLVINCLYDFLCLWLPDKVSTLLTIDHSVFW